VLALTGVGGRRRKGSERSTTKNSRGPLCTNRRLVFLPASIKDLEGDVAAVTPVGQDFSTLALETIYPEAHDGSWELRVGESQGGSVFA
jgi:hypothetical protein